MVVAVLVLLFALALSACGETADDAVVPASEASAEAGSGSLFGDGGFETEPPADWAGDRVSANELPPEALATLELIAGGGPYPYRQDGSTFHNREGFLPARYDGHYQEFTVETPGSPDRGARRLVVGEETEVYYTADHYASFDFVVP